MRLIELMVVRNEAHIVGFSLRAALKWVDAAVVLDHASTDGTRETLEEIRSEVGERLTILHEPDPEWRQFEYRQRVLVAARKLRGTHFAMLDADEVLTGDLIGRVRDEAQALELSQCLRLPMRCMWGPFQHRVGTFGFSDYLVSVAWHDRPGIYWRATDGYHHDHREPFWLLPDFRDPTTSGGLMHFQWIERRRVLAKHAMLKMEHRVRWPDEWPARRLEAQYNATVDESGLELRPAPAEWFAGYEDIIGKLRLGEEPWQAGECKRLWREFGPTRFEGLTLWGFTE